MARQYLRGRPRSTPAAPTTARLEGFPVQVAGDAVATWASAAADPDSGVAELSRPVTVGELREQIGAAGLRQAAIDAGRTPPSDRTIRRWIQQDRIPHDVVAELAQRRGLVTRFGGIKGGAAAMGVSDKTVSRYQTGKSASLRPTTERGLSEARATDALARADLADRRTGALQRRPAVTVTAAFQYRNSGTTSSDYRASRSFEIQLDEPVASDFAAAVAREDHAAAVAILERHLTLEYATTFADFDDDTGFHMESVLDFDVDWQ
ncbi:hypothetical protein [Nocardia sp. NPDC051570]|uniref:hypothetical protein n=1 Tax=Nocardia sp. NPDC051570 TaxID=3364324 RepID=UPI00379DD5C5